MVNHSGPTPKAGLVIFSVSSMLLANPIAVAQPPTCTPSIERYRSLVVTDEALDKTKFSFSRTIGAILSSMSIPNTADNRENFLKTLLTSFNSDALVNPVSGLRMRVDPRPLEAALDPKKLLDPADPTGLVPVALFNRLDLAPADWSDCGEHRIIYSFRAPIPTPTPLRSRFFLIFEARTANASSQKIGFEGCRPTANFWRSLTDERDAVKRAERLEQFYYTGIDGTAGPVVQAKNYGDPLGQVRGNFSVISSGASSKFQLREWVIVNSGQPTPASFVSVTVKDNPLAQFYLDANDTGLDAPLDPMLEASERVEFHKEFLNTSLTQLLEPDVVLNFLTPGQPGYKPELDPKNPAFEIEKYKIEILNRFGARFENRFNEFQSVSQGSEDNPKAKAPGMWSIFRADIDTKLGEFVIDPMQKPEAKHVLNRAGAVTCGGCHDFTSLQPVGQVRGQPILWPTSQGFVHVTESGDLSPALRDVFLPFRQDRLAEAVCIEKADQAITMQRQEEIRKPGYFVTNRRSH